VDWQGEGRSSESASHPVVRKTGGQLLPFAHLLQATMHVAVVAGERLAHLLRVDPPPFRFPMEAHLEGDSERAPHKGRYFGCGCRSIYNVHLFLKRSITQQACFPNVNRS